jgi:hypothetical protein
LSENVSGNIVNLFNALGYNITYNGGGIGALHQFDTSLPAADPIRYGPFSPYSETEKAKGMYWGQDGISGGRLSGFNKYGDAVVYTSGTNPYKPSDDMASAVRLTTKPFMWFADGGFAYPIRISNGYLPVVYPNFSDSKSISNSIIIANSVAWAITQTGNRTSTP